MIKSVIIAYIVLSGSAIELSDKVNKLLAEGYEPSGSLSCHQYPTTCCQAMVRRVDKEVNER